MEPFYKFKTCCGNAVVIDGVNGSCLFALIHVTAQVSSILGNVLGHARDCNIDCNDIPEELYSPERELLQRLLEIAQDLLNPEVLLVE